MYSYAKKKKKKSQNLLVTKCKICVVNNINKNLVQTQSSVSFLPCSAHQRGVIVTMDSTKNDPRSYVFF